jgi:hypothetical protein
MRLFLGKEVRVLLKGQGKEAYLVLKRKTDKESRTILNSFDRIKEILKDNPQFGDVIRKELIPKQYKKQGIHNLYRVELSNYWRALYTIKGNQVEILLFVLNIVDHKDYNKIFKYKK